MQYCVTPVLNATTGRYEWPELEVKPSKDPRAGFGLFAACPLQKNTVIPYYGKELAELTDNEEHNNFIVMLERHRYIDGAPTARTHDRVELGMNGKCIAAMANEPSRNEKANAVLLTDPIKSHRVTGAHCHIVTTRRIKQGDEIKISYNYEAGTTRSWSTGIPATPPASARR